MSVLKSIPFLILSLITLLHAGNNKAIQSLLQKLQQRPVLEHAQWSVYAAYTDNAREIINWNAEWSLAPASGLKLFTTAVALDRLGEQYQFHTRLYYDGEIDARGVLQGNLYIVGGGDPTLGSDRVAGSIPLDSLMSIWVEAIRNAGIRVIEGEVIADDLIFDRNPLPDDWFWVDMGNYYGAGTSGLCMHDNLYYLFFEPGGYVGAPTSILRTEPHVPGLRFDSRVTTGARGSGDNGYIYCAPKQNLAIVRGTIPFGVTEFSIKGSIPDPASFAAESFRQSMLKAGIDVSGASRPIDEPVHYKDTKLLHTTVSPELQDIVFIINKRSFNLYAEQLLKHLAVSEGKQGTTRRGTEIVKRFLEEQNINTSGLNLSDGCGLSRTNTITAKMMTELLISMTHHNAYAPFYNSLGIAGDPDDIGYFSTFGKGTVLAQNARIKSGLIQGVRSHSGYLKDRKGRQIAFSVITNNYQGRLSAVNGIHEQVLVKLAELR